MWNSLFREVWKHFLCNTKFLHYFFCQFSLLGNIHSDPLLGVLADNGGFTLTHEWRKEVQRLIQGTMKIVQKSISAEFPDLKVFFVIWDEYVIDLNYIFLPLINKWSGCI